MLHLAKWGLLIFEVLIELIKPLPWPWVAQQPGPVTSWVLSWRRTGQGCTVPQAASPTAGRGGWGRMD
jgi:hypothetical protein